MGYLNAGLFGEVRNKVGGVIFSNWKGINTAREYKVPANPQSPAQIAQRTKFAVIVTLAQYLLGSFIVTFWNPFAVKMSGFNAFIKSVFPDATSTGLLTVNCKVTRGTLYPGEADDDATYNDATGALSISYSAGLAGNAENEDFFGLLAIDKTNNEVLGMSLGNNTREDGAGGVILASGLAAANILVFGFFYRGSGSEFIVSDSWGVPTTAA